MTTHGLDAATLTFLGAAGTVTGSKYLARAGALSPADCVVTVLVGLLPVTAIEVQKLARRGVGWVR